MNDKSLKSISSKVSRQFPEVAKSKPKVQRQSGQKTKSSTSTYLITYRCKALTADGKSINRVVRVTADDDGKIIKITTSR
jgi:hypothetical protein